MVLYYLPNGKRFRRTEHCRRKDGLNYTTFLRRHCEGSETGGVIFRRQLSHPVQAHVRRIFQKSFYIYTNYFI
jgi:hypothetical protein